MDQPPSKLVEIARLARLGEVGEASSRWNILLEQVGRCRESQAFPPGLLPLLQLCLGAQERGDWVAWADALQYADPAVALWLEQIRESDPDS